MESPPTPLRLIGVSVAFAGVIWYAVFKLYGISKSVALEAPAKSATSLASKDVSAQSARSGWQAFFMGDEQQSSKPSEKTPLQEPLAAGKV